MPKTSINQYLQSLSKKLSKRKVIIKKYSDIKNYPLPIGKCIYILDYKERSVPFQKGIKEMLGYEPHEFTFELFTNYFHPDDYDIVTRLIRATLTFASEHNVTKDVGFCLNYRIKHKDGHYVRVLRQSTIYDYDASGRIISNLSMLTDISFLNVSNKVEWRFDAPLLDKEKFKKHVTKAYNDFFTEREMGIVKKIKQGKKSDEIAKELHISKHTVDTHRRKILKKSNCKNTVELLNFCSENGLL